MRTSRTIWPHHRYIVPLSQWCAWLSDRRRRGSFATDKGGVNEPLNLTAQYTGTHPELPVEHTHCAVRFGQLAMEVPPLSVIQLLEIACDRRTQKLEPTPNEHGHSPYRKDGLGGPGRLSRTLFTRKRRRNLHKSQLALHTNTACAKRFIVYSGELCPQENKGCEHKRW